MAATIRARQLLRDHFLKRFLDNDLISPNTDRHEVLVLLAASLVGVPGFVITGLLIGQKYLFGILTPAMTSIGALDDKFLYISASMLIMALMAAIQWDALALDERDAAILGPLPVGEREIGRAKLSALVIFVTAFALLLNGVPSVVFPLLTVSHFHVNIVAVVRMIVVHAAVTMAAGAYAFLTILLLRELLRVALGPWWFQRISAFVQSALLISLGTTLLLLPALASNVPARWLARSDALHSVPPAWFLGLYETGTGSVTLTIRGLGLRIPPRLRPAERDARILYDSLLPRFGQLAQVAMFALLATTVVALALYLWNNRRLPSPRVSRQRPHGAAWRFAGQAIGRVVVPAPLPRAGFAFTLQALRRSAQHRMSIAMACAVAVAMGILMLHGISAVRGPATAPTRLLALQTTVIVIILVGVRHALAIPAELRANWVFSMAWNGEMRPFVAGVKRAVIAGIILPLLMVMFGYDVYMLGTRAAVQHAAFGFVLSLIALEFLLRPERLPLTCSARPMGNLKALGPIYLMLLFVVAYNLGLLERATLGDLRKFAMLLGSLVLIYAGLRLSQRRQSILSRIEFDDLPDTPTQRLGLSEPV